MNWPFDFLDERPIVIALAGANGAGKSTFYESFLADAGLRFVNADVLSAQLTITAYEAADLAASLRTALVMQRESFVFETVLSDPVGEKVDTLAAYTALGYAVVLIFIRIGSPEESIRRVAMRVSQGGQGGMFEICQLCAMLTALGEHAERLLNFEASTTWQSLVASVSCAAFTTQLATDSWGTSTVQTKHKPPALKKTPGIQAFPPTIN